MNSARRLPPTNSQYYNNNNNIMPPPSINYGRSVRFQSSSMPPPPPRHPRYNPYPPPRHLSHNNSMNIPPPPPSRPPCLRPPSQHRRPYSEKFPTITPTPTRSHQRHNCPPSPSHSSLCPTSEITFIPSRHGSLRRHQRRISIRDLQSAMKHGDRRPGRPHPNGHTTSIYTFRGITYVVDDITKQEITSYATPLQLDYHTLTTAMWDRHNYARERIANDVTCWTSHSVCLVDVSGSMRESDVKGERTRLGAVFVSLLVDFIAHRIESGIATDMDVVTIILMGTKAEVLIKEMPTDWILYNYLLMIYNEEKVRPGGHGCYVPALEMAEEILTKNDYSSCALALLLMSDGKPSDFYISKLSYTSSNKIIHDKICHLASTLGRRLTVATVGMGSKNDFQTLKDMADAAKDYGSQGMFQLPSMTCSNLGQALSSVATSLTRSRTELTWRTGGQRRLVRSVLREKKSMIPLITEEIDEEEFHVFMGDDVVHMVYDPTQPSKFSTAPLQNPLAHGIALRKKAFGEGQERFAYQFFEIASDAKTVVGPALVAKESRFVDDWKDRDKFVKRFCSLQHQAKIIAMAFNERLDAMEILEEGTPRVRFLDCSVYYVELEGVECAVLVERKLDGQFRKWNSNNGNVFHDNLTISKNVRLEKRKTDNRDIYVIDDDDDDDDNDENDNNNNPSISNTLKVTPDDIAQAFSHFSYFHSSEKMLICDLQGNYDDDNKMFLFTDPVIHYHDNQKLDKTNVFGRTDRGRMGIDDFFASHVCNGLCRFVTRGFRESRPRKKQRMEEGEVMCVDLTQQTMQKEETLVRGENAQAKRLL